MSDINSTTTNQTETSAQGLPKWFWGAAAAVMLPIIGVATAAAVSYQTKHPQAATTGQLASAESGAKAAGAGVDQDTVLAADTCSDCGVVTAVTAHKVRGKASGVGAVAGGVLGGVIGNQFGKGSGKTAMTVVGAAGGALAGAQVEKNMKAYTVYDTQVRMSDGTVRSYRLNQSFAVGARVKAVNGTLQLVATKS